MRRDAIFVEAQALLEAIESYVSEGRESGDHFDEAWRLLHTMTRSERRLLLSACELLINICEEID